LQLNRHGVSDPKPPILQKAIQMKVPVIPRRRTPVLAGAAFSLLAFCAPSSGNVDEDARARVQEAYGKLPLSFEANQGQTDSQVRFLTRGGGYRLFLTASEAVLQLHSAPSTPSAVLRIKLVGANGAPAVVGEEEMPGQSHYFIGNDPSQWRTHVAHYRKVRYQEVYPGVDLVYYGDQRQLEYDFVVGPGADPHVIKISFAGAREVRIGEDGDLVLGVGSGEIRQHKPAIYQVLNGVRTEIAGGYRLEGEAQVSFEAGPYDANRPLVIDPVLIYSTYLGGSGADYGIDIAVDAEGSAYVTGTTYSVDFPVTAGALQSVFAGSLGDVFVTKLNRRGSAVVYSTYIGGSGSGFEAGAGIAVDKDGSAYVTGSTDSPDFPTTPGAFRPAFAGGQNDGFVTKLNQRGSALIYSTYLGGSGSGFEGGSAIAVDKDGSAYVAGQTDSLDFPITSDALQLAFAGGLEDAFVIKLNPRGSTLAYSTYLGGSGEDFSPLNGIAVDQDGFAFVMVSTESPDLLITSDAFQTANAGFFDVYLAKLNRRGSALAYSTYLGGSGYDFGAGVAVDKEGSAYMTGETESVDFPTTARAFQPVFAGGADDGFVTKLNRRGSALDYSTFFGGSSTAGYNDVEGGFDIAVHKDGSAYVTGMTYSLDFPTTPDAFQPTFAGGFEDAFVMKLNPRGSALIYSTYIGGSGSFGWEQGSGIALDLEGNVYVTGFTDSVDLPITLGAFQPAFGEGGDAFVVKIGRWR
jgi:hypothetical protein